MLERGFVLPNYDFKRPNPKIPWKEWNMKACVTLFKPFSNWLTINRCKRCSGRGQRESVL